MPQLTKNHFFIVAVHKLKPKQAIKFSDNQTRIIGIIKGKLHIQENNYKIERTSGQFCIIPASLSEITITPTTQVTFLEVQQTCK